jgi:oleate hydratase
MSPNSKAYLVGGGIGSLAAAAFMIRDGKLPGGNISILEAAPVMGGSLDGSGALWAAIPCAADAC